MLVALNYVHDEGANETNPTEQNSLDGSWVGLVNSLEKVCSETDHPVLEEVKMRMFLTLR